MEANIILRKEDLNLEFIEKLKGFSKKSHKLQLAISDVEDFELNKKETKEEYFKRLVNASKNVVKNKLSFRDKDFLDKIKEEL
jgi:hypothetical protein